MRTLLAGTNVCGNVSVRYFLLAEELEAIGEIYGLRIESGQDAVTIHRITLSQTRIQELIRLLISGIVTPVTARDVVEDWLLT